MKATATMTAVRAAARRAWAADALVLAGWGACTGAGLSAVAVGVARVLGQRLEFADWWRSWPGLIVAAVAAGLLGGVGVSVARRWSMRRAAFELDRVLNLHDVLRTGVELSEVGEGEGGPFAAIAIQRSETAARVADVRRVADPGQSLRHRSWGWAFLIGGCAVAVGLWVPATDWRARMTRESKLTEASREETREAIGLASQAALEQPATSERDLTALKEVEAELSSKRGGTDATRVRAASLIDRVAGQLEDTAERERAHEAAVRSALAKAGADRGSGDSELVKALRRGELRDAADMAEMLRQGADQMPPKEREKLAAELERLAASLEAARDTSDPGSREAESPSVTSSQQAGENADQPSAQPRGESGTPESGSAAEPSKAKPDGEGPTPVKTELDRLREAFKSAADDLRQPKEEPPAPSGSPTGEPRKTDGKAGDAKDPAAQPGAHEPGGEKNGGAEQKQADAAKNGKRQAGGESARDTGEKQNTSAKEGPRQGSSDDAKQRQNAPEEQQTGTDQNPKSGPAAELNRQPKAGEQLPQPPEPGPTQNAPPPGQEQSGEKATKQDSDNKNQGVKQAPSSQGEKPKVDSKKQPSADGRGGEQKSAKEGERNEGAPKEPSRGVGPTSGSEQQPRPAPGNESLPPDAQPGSQQKSPPGSVPAAGQNPRSPDGQQGQPEGGNKEGVGKLAGALKELAERSGKSKASKEQAEQLREQAQKLLGSMSPEQRRELERIAKEIGQGEGARTSNDPGSGLGPMVPPRERGAARIDPAGSKKEPVDLRGGQPPPGQGERVIAQWDASPKPGDAGGTAGGLDEGVKRAAEGVERAIEQQQVPARYSDLVRRVFKKYVERIEAEKK